MSKFYRRGSREHKTPKSKRVPNGTPLGIHDCNGDELCMGDYVVLLETPVQRGEFEGRINDLEKRKAVVALRRWETHALPLDDGERMLVRKMRESETEEVAFAYEYYWGERGRRRR